MQSLKSLQFIYLTAFSKTGGIEKFNKNVIYSLNQLKDCYNPSITSLYDSTGDSLYHEDLPTNFFSKKKWGFFFHCLKSARKTDLLLVGHINLSPIVFGMRTLNPKLKVIVFTHGVEVWQPLSGFDSSLMRAANRILCVSKFTKRMLREANSDVDTDKIQVFLNAVDPFYQDIETSNDEIQKLAIQLNADAYKPILLSVGRICSEDAYKGFDQTIQSLAQVKKSGLNPLYLLIGKYEVDEHQRLLKLAEKNQVTDNVVFLGFVDDKSLAKYCKLSDLFVMPSKGEGFGIVFIEAIRNKMAIIAANTGGTPEALGYGKYGRLVDPDNIDELALAIKEEYYRKKTTKQNNWDEIMNLYGIERFTNQLSNHIAEII